MPSTLQGLADASAYPHPVRNLRIIETHISWVILTGDFAYKIKRPVRLPFVDFSTLERRRYFCEEELRLNERFAPELYLDVCSIGVRGGRAIVGGAGPPIEYAVRMRQFDSRDELAVLLQHDHVLGDSLAEFAADLAHVQRGLAVCGTNREPARTQRIVRDNAAQCAAVPVDDDLRERLQYCRWLLAQALDRSAPFLVARDRDGYVREGHGDLHLSNVARIGGRLRAFDCLEFEPEFRRLDVAQEVAFLCMDLFAQGYPALASVFQNAWLAASGDYAACEGFYLYQAHCALVRAKVAGISAPNVAAPERVVLTARQRVLVELAIKRLTRRRPALVLMHGVSGSGKSWLAGQLATELPAIWIRSDIERKRSAGLSVSTSSRSSLGTGLYAPDRTEATYVRLAQAASSVLSGDQTALVDATFLRRAQRQPFIQLAQDMAVPVLIVACHAPAAILRDRVAARLRAASDPSEATIAVLEQQLQQVEAPSGAEGVQMIDANSILANTGHEVLRQLRRWIPGDATPVDTRSFP